VDLFFVLSGFLIGGILLDSRRSPDYFRTFYARRFFRILPIYYVSLGLFLTVATIGADIPGLNWLVGKPLPWLSFATFTQNIVMALQNDWGPNWTNVTWSLAIEEQFYLLLPLFIRFIPHRRLPMAIGIAVVSAPVIRTLLWAFDLNIITSGYALMPCRADGLGMGVLAAIFLRRPGFVDFLRARKRWVLAAVVVLASGVVGLTLARASSSSLLLNSVGYTWLVAFYLSLMIVVVVWPQTILGAAMRNPALIYLGTVSYFVYLFHQPVHGLAHFVIGGAGPVVSTWGQAATTALALVVTLLLARVSWVFFERPLIQYGHAYKYRSA
jgi:peptidoglycan/LPS O-acetylase OafA/YrhL